MSRNDRNIAVKVVSVDKKFPSAIEACARINTNKQKINPNLYGNEAKPEENSLKIRMSSSSNIAVQHQRVL